MQRIVGVPVSTHWSDFEGPDEDYGAALEYLSNKFLAKSKEKDRVVHVRYTDATDTETFKATMQSIEELILDHCS